MSRTYHPKERTRDPSIKLRRYKLAEKLERQVSRQSPPLPQALRPVPWKVLG